MNKQRLPLGEYLLAYAIVTAFAIMAIMASSSCGGV